MAKQKAFLVVGLPHAGARLRLALDRHRDALAQQRIQQPARSEEEIFRAAVWIRHDHRAWSLQRKDVDGAWGEIWRRAWATKDTVLLGHDLFAGMTKDEIALVADRFPGFALHVVLLVGPPDARVALFPDELDLADVVERWSAAVKSPDRVHVIAVDPGDPAPAWKSLGRVVGFDAAPLELPAASEVTDRADPAALRLIAEAGGAGVTSGDLAELAGSWAKLVADQGYDVHGDLSALAHAPARAETDTDTDESGERVAVLSGALSESVVEIVRLRERVNLLEHRHAKSERKRRKLKKRLKTS